MSDLPIRQICASAIICGAAMSFLRPGPIKQIASMLTSAILLITLWNCVSSVELKGYSLYTAKLSEAAELSRNAKNIEKDLTGEVIRSRCETYIMDKARAMNIMTESVKVELRWSMDGVWVPYSVTVTGERSELLEQSITAELGIPRHRQKWISINE